MQDASLTISTNETVGLIGWAPGKSTLINILVGNRHKDNGSITFFGEEEHTVDDVEYKEHIGVVFDDLRVPSN